MNVRYVSVSHLMSNSWAVGEKPRVTHWEQGGQDGRWLPFLLCSAWAGVAGPQSPCAAAKTLAQPCAPGLGTSSVYVMKGSRRWLFLSTAFAHTCAGPEPGWKLSPHEQRGRWEGRERERGPEAEGVKIKTPTHAEKSL